MKKIVSLLLTCTMLVSMVAVSAANWTLPETASKNSTIRFGIIADSHIATANLASTSSKVKTAAMAHKSLGADALVLCGDIVMHQTGETTKDSMVQKYTYLKNALAEAGASTVANTADVEEGKLPVIYATGNHEFPIGAGDGEVSNTSLEVFSEQMGAAQNSHTVIKGIHFITSGGNTYSSYAFHQEEWMKEQINTAVAATPDKPVFLVLHHPIHGTVGGSSSGDKRYSDDFVSFLNTKSNVIVISAHTHLPVQSSNDVWQNGFSAVTSGYLCGGNDTYSQGLFAEVDGSIVTFYKLDLNTNEYIEKPWVIDITDLSDYTDAGRESANAPKFANDAKITVSNVASESVDLTWDNATCVETGAYQDNYIDSYQVKVTDDNGNVVSEKTAHVNYWAKSDENTTTYKVEGLTGGKTYKVSVKAVSGLGKVSGAITQEFTTIDPALEPSAYLVIEAEDYVSAIYADNPVASTGIIDDSNASGKAVRHPGGGIWYTYNFKPTATGYYTIELVADGDIEQPAQFEVNDSQVFNANLNTTSAWGLANAQKTVLYSGNLTAGINYKLDFVSHKTLTLDYFNIYFKKYIEAENGTTKANLTNAYSEDGTLVDAEMVDGASQGMAVKVKAGSNLRLPVSVEKQGLYAIGVMAQGNANVTARIDENIAGGRVVKTGKNVALAANGVTDNVAVFFMDKGSKTLTLSFDGDVVADYVSLTPLSTIKADGTLIETEKYVNSNTPAYTALYGDYANGIYASGIAGTNINADYEFILSANTRYRFDIIGNVLEDTAVSVSFNDGQPISVMAQAGANNVYVATVDLKAGKNTLNLSTSGNILINAITYEKGEGKTEFLLNAETDYDKESGHGVGWYDTTPDSHDDQWQIRDTYGWLDVIGGSEQIYNNDVGNAVLYMLSNEWLNYKVDIDYPGYYRILLGIKFCEMQGNPANFTVTVNGDTENAITKPILRTNLWLAKNYDDFGLVWLDKGTNTINVKFDTKSGQAQFDAMRIVAADVGIYKTDATIVNKIECETGYSADSSIGMVQEAGSILMYPDNWAQWTITAPEAGEYKIIFTGNGSDKTTEDAPVQYPAASVVLTVNGTEVGTYPINNSNSWEGGKMPLDTVLATVNLNAGENTIKLKSTGNTSSWNSISYTTTGDEKVMNITGGTYKLEAKLGNWYTGNQWDNSETLTAYGKEYKPVLFAAVYNSQGELVATKMSANIDELNTLTISDVELANGDKVAFMIWDGNNLKPLMSKIIRK